MSGEAEAASTAPESVFARLGGEAGVSRILDLLYDQVMQDDLLREYFCDVDLARLKATQRAFLHVAFGEPGATYAGNRLCTQLIKGSLSRNRLSTPS